MNPEELKAAGFSDTEIKEYTDLQSAGFSEQEITDHYNKSKVVEKPKDDPLLNKLARAVDPYTKYALPIAGAIGGGLLAAPANIIAPGVAEVTGVGLGTLGGQQAANYIGNLAGRRGGFDPYELITREIPEAGINAVATPAINKILPYITTAGKQLYGNTIKTPITNKWTKLYPNKEGTAREIAVTKGYEENIYPTNYGIKKTASKVDELNNQVNKIVDEGTVNGHTVSRYDLIQKGLASAKNQARVADPEAASVISKLQSRVESIGNPKEMTTRDLLDLKRQLYKETTWDGKSLSTATEKQFNEVGKKGLAHEAMLQLEHKYPQLEYLNKEESAYLDLKEALEKTVAKHEQQIQPSSKGIWIALKNLPAAIAEETFNHPLVKARLAFALKNAAARKGVIAKPTIYGTTANTREE
jgi:hypothetical protein